MVVNHLISIAKKHRTLIVVFFATRVVWVFLDNFVPYYFQTVVDNFTGGVLKTTHIAVYGAALIANYILSYLMDYPAKKLERNIEQSLKIAALRKLSVIDYLSYTKLGTGALIQRIENGASAGRFILFEYYLRLAGELLPGVVFSLVFVLSINKTVMTVIVFGYVLVFAVSNLLLKVLYKVKERILVNEEKFNHFLVRGFMEMVTFRFHRRFKREIQKTEDASKEIVSSAVKIRMAHEAFFTAFAILIGFVKIGVIVYGWTTEALTIGQIVALLVLVDNAYTPIAIFNVDYVAYKLEKIAFARYTAFLDAKEDGRLARGEAVEGLRGGITFSRVGFRYDGREVLADLNLRIAPGQTVAFVGESGSGKSTAVKLLAGLLQPESGRVDADGHDLKRIDLDSYYKHIACLPQEPSVFNGTLRENLVFDEAVGDDALAEAVADAGLDGLLGKLEKGFDTPLGKRGVSLSGGERQQLALARLWFSEAAIVILDEATSAIDNLTEEAVMKNVMARLAGKTVLAVAHRLDSVKSFDIICVFRDGRVAEQGGFDELMAKRAYFYELYHRMNEPTTR